MLTPEQAANAENLMAEAITLGEELKQNLGQLVQAGLDAIKLITVQQEASTNLETVAKYGHILAGSGDSTQRMMRLLDMTGNILRECVDDHYPEQLSNFLREFKGIDPAKIADEDLLRELDLRSGNVFDMNSVISLCAASAQIPIFFLAFAQSDLMRAYVGKPPFSRRALDNASELGTAVVMDVTGTAIPFFGTALAAFKLMTPWLEREKARTAKAVSLVDKIFDLDRGLATLSEYGVLVEGSVSQVSEFLSAYRESFDQDIAWLIRLSRAARGELTPVATGPDLHSVVSAGGRRPGGRSPG